MMKIGKYNLSEINWAEWIAKLLFGIVMSAAIKLGWVTYFCLGFLHFALFYLEPDPFEIGIVVFFFLPVDIGALVILLRAWRDNSGESRTDRKKRRSIVVQLAVCFLVGIACALSSAIWQDDGPVEYAFNLLQALTE